jgi:hypothetical protein
MMQEIISWVIDHRLPLNPTEEDHKVANELCAKMIDLCLEHEDLLETRSFPEIERLATRIL